MRFFPRALLHEVAKDGADGGRFLDAGDDPHGATAVDAGGDVVTLAVAGAAVAACALNAALSFSTAIGSGGACDVSKFNIFYSGMDTPFTTAHIASAIATGAPASPLRRISPPHSRAWLRSDPRCSGNVASQTLLWCDEYPFASTDRGGQANGPSLMLVPAVEQMYQGGMLSAFYFACNVVANDPLNGVFGVVPGTPTTSWQCK